ncbi:PREDICTED: calcium and integrin-binding family member 2-like [Priapulus caudatus]|uniref:Calcium and integrin-binding family member 2-like n=1 Tax=Priapulus caudatus TaxID=37621 RepID=A0ABM1EKS0_PRICU|nr:PREDICTED: calcium and integrin-binding family member 2-like [Priapulus caudatus]
MGNKVASFTQEQLEEYQVSCVYFDQDQLLSKYDLEKTVRCLTKDNLNQEEIDMVCDKVLEEADLDEDGMLSFIEFEHVISRAPDFVSTFHIRM